MKKIIIFSMMIMLISLVGCSGLSYEDQEILRLRQQIIELEKRKCPVCDPIYVDRIIQNNTLEQEERQRYVIRVKELEYYLNQVNDTDVYFELERNYTNCKSRFKQMNESFIIIRDEFNKFE